MQRGTTIDYVRANKPSSIVRLINQAIVSISLLFLLRSNQFLLKTRGPYCPKRAIRNALMTIFRLLFKVILLLGTFQAFYIETFFIDMQIFAEKISSCSGRLKEFGKLWRDSDKSFV